MGGFICCVDGGPTAWESKKQVEQALSSVESEYMALFRAIRGVVWQRRLLAELGEEQQGPTPLYCDSQGAIALAKNPVLHGLTKHMKQTKGKDYDEVFAPVGKGTTLRVLLAIAALLGWKIRQMDIVTAFLNGIIMEEVYMKQPEGLDDGSGRVCRLKKAIYGLKQAPRAWYHKLEEALLAGGFKKSECDPSLFLLQEKDEILMLLGQMSKLGFL
ncbi:hypothetical protein CLOP_g8763 [Closterium sp. NIES-67]|nr:hypothetical protein CLOP_g8763 [Closterium sp. NIES-67]